jgi:hypothetical protein
LNLTNIRTTLATAIALLIITQLTLASGAAAEPRLWIDDFIGYWAAGRLTINGVNPYDPPQVMATELLVNPSMPVTMMMWNPPWTISLVMPLSFLDYRTARTLWALIQMALVMVTAGWLWQFYGGRTSTAYLIALAALLFPASLIALGNGQISPVLLLGLCAFLYLEERGRDMLAGLVVSITLVKPHLVYLIWAAIVLWSFHRKRLGVLAGALAGTAVLMIVPVLLDPSIIRQYLTAIRDFPPKDCFSPTAGTLARLMLGWEKWWPQLLPNLVGAAWLVWYWLHRRQDWRWKNQLPVILVASVLTSMYGWLFDQVLFLLPVIQLTTQLRQHWRSWHAKAAGMMLVLACMLSIVLWPLCIRLIYHPRTAQLAGTAISMALREPNQFWEIVVLPVFWLGFLIGWKGHFQVASNRQSLSNPGAV